MSAERIIEAVLMAQWIVVSAGCSERRTATADGVNVDAVLAGREALHVNVDVNNARGVFGEAREPDDLTASVFQFSGSMLGAVTLGVCASGKRQNDQHG
jgi:hypothetical protein